MRERQEFKMQNFISFLMALNFFENYENFSLGIITSLSKLSLHLSPLFLGS